MRIQVILVVVALGCLTAPSWAQVRGEWVTFGDERGTRVESSGPYFLSRGVVLADEPLSPPTAARHST